MNTWSFQAGSQSTKITDPLTFTNKDIMKNNLDNIIQEEKIQDNNNRRNQEGVDSAKLYDYYKDLKYEGERTNELRNFSRKEPPKIDNEINVVDDKNTKNENMQNNMHEEDIYNNRYIYDKNINLEDVNDVYGQHFDDYYYISEFIPPQNFSEKLRNIKIKYQKLKEEIEFLKRENKKYNPNFIIRNYNYNNKP